MIDAYLKLTPVGATLQGESADSVFAKAIELRSFDTGASVSADANALPPNRSKRGRDYAPFGFEVTKEVDATSPYLFQAYCTTFSRRFLAEKNLYRKAEVTFRKAGKGQAGNTGEVYLTLEFEHVLLTGYSLDTKADGESEETVEFAFRICKLRYQAQSAGGETQPPPELKGWDYRANTPV